MCPYEKSLETYLMILVCHMRTSPSIGDIPTPTKPFFPIKKIISELKVRLNSKFTDSFHL